MTPFILYPVLLQIEYLLCRFSTLDYTLLFGYSLVENTVCIIIVKRIFFLVDPGGCISNPTLCPRGLTVAFWLKFFSGQYIISSGGSSRFATGFDFYRESAAGKFNLILETSTHQWSLKLNDIPKVGDILCLFIYLFIYNKSMSPLKT